MAEERRLVTVLFADVTGSTALGEDLDPEDLRVLLSRYYAIAKDVVAAHGGTVEKFIGDAVMAVFGLRQAHGDDAARAVAAAIELRDRVRSDPKLGDRLPVRLGVNTGDVVASRDESSGDFLVTGDAVNVAARLQQAAPVWAILAGERTVRAAHDDFRFGPEQSVEAKGKPGGIRASEVAGRARAAATRTPLFGRNADLAQIELVARRAFDERRPFLVSVIAPPGTGKSRLLEEFLSRLPSIGPQARVAVAQCLPYGQRLTYWPLRAVLFRVVGLDEESTPEQVRGAVDRWLRDADVEEATEVGALLASTVGAGEAETSDQSALFAAWRTFIEIAGRSSPLVLVIEDLHWSSDSLLDLIEFVLQPRADTRALMVVLARPELLDRRPTWGGGRRNHVSIALEPLDDDSIGELVHHLAEGTPPAFLEAVVARAEGNPFFATEIVNALLERVRSLDDPREIGAALERLPDNVQATVLARLDLLPEEEREVIRVGAVFGRTFRPAGVAALMPDGRSAVVAEACEQLVERDLIRPSAADGYAFRHILIREVAYGTLPRAARALLHGAAGRWLEASARGREDAFAELVAYHFREAASLSSALELDDAPALRAQALTWLVRAAEAARAAAATVEASQHMRAAIEYGQPEELPELYELLGDVEVGGSAIVDVYKVALDLARERGRTPNDQLRILAKMLMVETRSQGSVANRPSFDEFNRLRLEGRQLLHRATDQLARARFLAAEAFLPFWARTGGHDVNDGMLKTAEDSAEQALELARELDDANLQSATLDALGSIAQDRGDWQRAIELGQRRIAMGTRLALSEQIDAHAVVTWSSTISGDLALADRVSAAGLAAVQPRQAPDWALHLAVWRDVALLLMGRWDDVQTTTDRAYGMWTDTGRHSAGYALRGFICGLIVARARRDEDRIRRWSETIDEISAQFELRRDLNHHIARWDIDKLAESVMADRQARSTVHREQLALYISICTDASREIDEGLLESMLDDARSANARILEAEILRALGLVRQDQPSLAAANEIFVAAGALPYAARTQCELATMRSDRAELESGLAYLELIRDEVQVERYLRIAAALR